jgi:hypothetical protein
MGRCVVVVQHPGLSLSKSFCQFQTEFHANTLLSKIAKGTGDRFTLPHPLDD